MVVVGNKFGLGEVDAGLCQELLCRVSVLGAKQTIKNEKFCLKISKFYVHSRLVEASFSWVFG